MELIYNNNDALNVNLEKMKGILNSLSIKLILIKKKNIFKFN